jgi:hypothetical protein
MSEGEPFVRQQWRQVDKTENASPEQVQLVVPQPKSVEIFYKVFGKVDQHNHDQQDTLGLEKSQGKRLVHVRQFDVWSMIFVDAWKAWSLMSDNAETQKEFYDRLATELIVNSYNIVRGRDRQSARNLDDKAAPIGGTGPHITPTKLLLTDNNGTKLTHCHQGAVVIGAAVRQHTIVWCVSTVQRS